MKTAVHQWLDSLPWREGFLVYGVRHPDRTFSSRARGHGFEAPQLEAALHSVAEIFNRLERESLNYGRLCLVYRDVLLHADRHADGICFVVFTMRDPKLYDAAGLDKTFTEFQKLSAAPAHSQ